MGTQRVCARINLKAVDENFRVMKKNLLHGEKICAVVKTNAYGHGAVRIAAYIENDPQIWGFAVATAEEGRSLRHAGIRKPILVLGYVFAEDYEDLARLEIRPAVFKTDMAAALSKTGEKLGRKLPVHLALDTGMSRIGFGDSEESVKKIRQIASLPGIEIEGMFTHFARADEADKSTAQKALQRYLAFADKLERAGIPIPLRHCSNSASILELPEAHLDMVRAGITIYGIYPSDEMDRKKNVLQPVMELKSHIAYIKKVPAGTPVSYGGTFVTERETRVATIPVGYGDGYPRSLSNKGYVLIGGQTAPIIGRVCMDQFMVDVTDIEAHEQEEVTLLGKDGGAFLGIDELGRLSGRFPYEFACCINERVPRVYLT